ncbi:hypothetical protein [Paenibacillus solanacearum]|uniref:hypothetical protein n=1 Tax=Paenibacillus solanacearum TaxID=2048548 RepID=UPI001C40592F|nr:hypothetical protein [Paenibacillus solanacearum]
MNPTYRNVLPKDDLIARWVTGLAIMFNDLFVSMSTPIKLRLTPYSRCGPWRVLGRQKLISREVDSGDTPAPPNRISTIREPIRRLAPCSSLRCSASGMLVFIQDLIFLFRVSSP